MGEPQEGQLHTMVEEAKEIEEVKETNLSESTSALNESTVPSTKNYNWWIRISIYTVFLLFGQSVATLLGRLYFVKGGHSKWMATLVQLIGFPILIPYLFISTIGRPNTNVSHIKPPSVKKFASVYVSLGLLVAADCYLYSIGLKYLPVSTYTMISASQLAFNSFFSFLFNLHKFTPYIVNSLVLLTISSVLLIFNNESSDPSGVTKVKYAIGFLCTVAASALYGLLLTLTQLYFKKVMKNKHTFKAVVDLIIYEQMVAAFVILIGLFASGDWKGLTKEMDEYETGKVSYVMNLVGTVICWEVFAIGSVGLIFEVSSLFTNAIIVLGLPIVPVLAVFVFHDKMNGVKVISLVLATWGFISYVYQHYIDDRNSKVGNRNDNSVSIAPTMES